MSKIISRLDLNVGTELIIDEPNRTYQLVATGNLVEKDGVAMSALFSKFSDLWLTVDYQDSPFPMNPIDTLSGQYQIGIDAGGNPNGWRPLDDATRNMQRDGGAEEYDASGTLVREYTCIVGLGVVNIGAQLYYQKEVGGTAIDFIFADQCNQQVQVYGDASNGDFDNRAYFKAFVREQGYKFKSSVLADTGKTSTGAFIVNMLLSNETDNKITDLDSEMSNAPYDGVTVEYFTTDQNRTINGVVAPFRIIISNINGASLKQVYTKVQYLLRQNSDIDTGTGTVIGKIADALCAYDGDTLVTTTGVYIDDVLTAEFNDIKFTDYNNIERTNKYLAAGLMSFNSKLIGSGSSYRLLYKVGPGTTDDYGEANAITVKDADGVDITGEIIVATKEFSFDYDNDTLGGDTGTDKDVVLIALRPGYGKFAVNDDVALTRTKTISIAVVAETDRAYIE